MAALSDLQTLYLLLVAPLLLAWVARRRPEERYTFFSRQPNRRFASGIEAARHLLASIGLAHVGVERVRGRLSDHNDPSPGSCCCRCEQEGGRK